jgi:ribonuclease VapC
MAIVLREPEAPDFRDAVRTASTRLLSTSTRVVIGIVALVRRGDARLEQMNALIEILKIDMVPLPEDHAEIAIDAFRRFGKGRHPAGLNFGDCFAYALAMATGEPLLFKGEDFSKTEVKRAI